MAKIKKNLSLDENILNKGLARAEQLGYNFSSYITYLINKDTASDKVIVEVPVIETKIEEPVQQVSSIDNTSKNNDELKIDKKVLSEADNILENF